MRPGQRFQERVSELWVDALDSEYAPALEFDPCCAADSWGLRAG
jgi:hypothetical protein